MRRSQSNMAATGAAIVRAIAVTTASSSIWELPGFDDGNGLTALRKLLPVVKIIVSTWPEAALAASAAQADAFICKADPPAEILNAIHRLNGKN